jgi:cyclomaltodextrinase / maltogenic alpha-amylase / neopullulanase
MTNNEIATPEWVKDAVFYQIFPDRFAKSARLKKPANLESWNSPPTVHGYKGGDLYGVMERLDYLEDLGITAIYFNPVFQSGSNHRYHTYDYYHVDPLLGGNEALRELLDACDARGIRVILDGVFNHASRGFFQFHDILENGSKSPYLDWFHIKDFPLNAYDETEPLGYAAWWNLPALPKFNTATLAVREFLWDVATYWLQFGVHGWRLDVPNEIADDSFWREFRRRCREVRPDCYIVGEIWDEAGHWLQGDQFDAVMNYPFTRAALGFFGAKTLNEKEIRRCGYQHIPSIDKAEAFAAVIETLLRMHSLEVNEVQLNLLGSHDTPRTLTILSGDEEAYKMALLFMMSYPGAPCLYYGEELGLFGDHDPGCRQSMPWDHAESWNHDLRRYAKDLIALRKAHVALRRGSFRSLYAKDNLFILAREHENERLIVIFNVAKWQAELDLELKQHWPELEGRYRDPLDGLAATVREGRMSGHDIPPRSGIIFKQSGR